ncbi:trihelix transcription factor ASIL2-like [Impatiens glandulifera]|uniref:trihelix transcription factor ASIL2-like n=1 Tax=Impatiens glandulifera TaxID=253017 RepID=UPI001FB0668F|nr:trihelix transcription factor ASIL2-like [Impatiens glandulifera]XP_047313224.1 trihelix transcription factor ASIL2-like [Impatiens glandulifera]
MGDNEDDDDARYPPRQYSTNHQSAYQSSSRPHPSNRNPTYVNGGYRDEDEYELEEEDEGLNTEPDDQEDEDDYDDGAGNGYNKRKKRKLESLVSNYEFVARKPPQNVRNPTGDWTEQSTLELLEAWGERFLELGRKSLRSEDWQELAEKVSDSSKVDWTETQCRNRLDTLKKRYRKEKAKMEGNNSQWILFKKMDMLLNPSAMQQGGLPCGVDSGEYVFMNSRVYLNRSNGLDEMRDSPGESEASMEEDESSFGIHSKRNGESDNGSSFKLLADSIQKFGDIYEKIENNKRQQMAELEKMRMDFQKELEVQKKQILEKAHAEIAKIRQEEEDDNVADDNDDDDDEATDGSDENLGG